MRIIQNGLTYHYGMNWNNGTYWSIEDLKINGERRKRIKEDREYARLGEIYMKKMEEYERNGINPAYGLLMECCADDGLF